MAKSNLSAMFGEAAALEDVGERNPAAFLNGNTQSAPKPQPVEPPQPQVEKEAPAPQPQPQPQPVVQTPPSQPVQQPKPQPAPQPSADLPKIVTNTINTLNFVKKLKPEIQASIKEFIKVKEGASDDTMITSLLTFNRGVVSDIHVVSDCMKLDSVAKAFYLMGIPDAQLTTAGKMLEFQTKVKESKFTTTPNENKIEYCKELLNLIDSVTEEQKTTLETLSELFKNLK